jgi:phasin family protein
MQGSQTDPLEDRERFSMNNVEQFQKHAQEQNEAALASASAFAANAKTITTAHAEYTKKAFQDFSEFISKLTSLKSPDEAMKLQADYVKTAYETIVAESKKISELYTDFAKQTFKPFEGLIAKMNPAK